MSELKPKRDNQMAAGTPTKAPQLSKDPSRTATSCKRR
jgi:hypothetical protein